MTLISTMNSSQQMTHSTTINESSVIEVRLSVQPLGANSFIIGNKNSNCFIKVPYEFIYIYEMTDGVNSIFDIQNKIYNKYHVLIDVMDFMQHLLAQGLIYSLDGVVVGFDNRIDFNKHLIDIANVFFSTPMIFFYVAIIIFNATMMLLNPQMRPSGEDIELIKALPGLNTVLFFAFSWVITLLHEFGHFLAGVKLGVSVHIRLSLRLFFLVVESDINGVWAANKKDRDICYLAGFFFESIVMFLVILVQLFSKNACALKYSRFLALILFLNFIWQFLIFLRTDLYLIILNHLSIESLHAECLHKLKGIVSGKRYVFDRVHAIYAFVYIVGFIASFCYFLYSSRIVFRLAFVAFCNIMIGDKLMDSLLFLLSILVSILLWGYGLYNSRQESL